MANTIHIIHTSRLSPSSAGVPLMRVTASFLALLLAATPGLCGSAAARILWVEGKPHAEIRLDGVLPAELKEIDVPAELSDDKGLRLWAGPIKVKRGEERVWKTVFPLPNIKEPKK